MPASRRLMITTVLAATGLAITGCQRRVAGPRPPPPARHLDRERLNQGFARLAARAAPGTLNLGVMSLDSADRWVADDQNRYPMQSVFKAPLAAAALAEVDAGRLKLNETIRVADDDREPWSSRLSAAVAAAGPAGGVNMPVVDLIALAVQESDNVAADVLMRRIGGPGAVTAFLRAHGIGGWSVDRYEREVQPRIAGLGALRPEWRDARAWAAARDSVAPQQREAAVAAYLNDARDTATAGAALDFLAKLAAGALLGRASTALLLRLMTDTATGPHRLKAGLPAGAVLAHKTGTSATVLGATPATNDIGLVTLADGSRLAMVALLKGSTATEAQRDALIADGARLMLSALK